MAEANRKLYHTGMVRAAALHRNRPFNCPRKINDTELTTIIVR
jgi:hypothetical protein